MVASNIIRKALMNIENKVVVGATQVAITCLNAIADASMISTAKLMRTS